MNTRDCAHALIDLSAISANVQTLARCAGDAQVLAVVKADGYGHGAVESARAARNGGAQWLGVVSVDEAVALRDSGDSGAIIAWRTSQFSDFTTAVARDIDVSAAAPAAIEAAAAAARNAGGQARVHLALDSGLGREGAPLGQQWDALIAAAAAQPREHVDVVGVWSHLAFADDPHHPTIDAQRNAFIAAVEQATSVGLDIRIRHLANSAATLTRPDLHFDLVRPGLAIYGISPLPTDVPSDAAARLRAAMTLKAPVVTVKNLPSGHGVGYAHAYHTQADTTMALLAAGYAEGIPRSAANSAPLQLNGTRFTLAGRISMDQISVDVG